MKSLQGEVKTASELPITINLGEKEKSFLIKKKLFLSMLVFKARKGGRSNVTSHK